MLIYKVALLSCTLLFKPSNQRYMIDHTSIYHETSHTKIIKHP